MDDDGLRSSTGSLPGHKQRPIAKRVMFPEGTEIIVSGAESETYELTTIKDTETEVGSASPEEEGYVFSDAVKEADHEFVDLVDRVEKFWHTQEQIGERVDFKNIRRKKASVITECVLIGITCTAIILSATIILVQNVDALRNLLPEVFNTPMIQGIVLMTLAVTSGVAVISGICLMALRSAERTRKNQLLDWLLEDAVHRTNAMFGIDERMLAVYASIQKVQHDLDRRISFLEHRGYEHEGAIAIVEGMHKECRSRVGTLDASFSKHLTQFNQQVRDIACKLEQLVQTSADDTKNVVCTLRERIKSSELSYKRSHEEVLRCSSMNVDIIRSTLSNALEGINASCEAMKAHAIQANSNIAAILKNNLYEAKALVESVIKRRYENMETVSYMLSNRDAAAAAACITLCDMCENMKKVRDFHAARKYDCLKKKLAYNGSGTGALMDFFNAYLINETIVILYDILVPELASISSITPELREAMKAHKSLEQHGDRCRSVITNCHDKLFGPNGILYKRKYDAMKDKLETIMTLQSLETGGTEEAINAIKACVPSLMVFPQVLQVAESVARIYESSQSMYSGFASVQCNLERAFTFLQTQQSVGSNVSVTGEVEPVAGASKSV